MQYAPVLGIQKPVSRVVLGTMVISAREQERSSALLDAALAQGVTTLDSAIVYGGGESERGIGQWMQERGCRERMVVLTKGCIPSQDRSRVTSYDMAADIHESLARLKTSYIDIWMLHRDDESGRVAEILSWPRGAIAGQAASAPMAPRTGAISASRPPTRPRGRAAGPAYRALQPELRPGRAGPAGPWGGGCVTISGPDQAAARAWYAQERMPVFAYSSLGRGLFSGRVCRENLETAPQPRCRVPACLLP